MEKIAMLISGGVDSSVALRLLKDEGYDITAFYIKIWMEDKFNFLGKCPWQEDLKYVEEICHELGVPLEIVNLQKEYWDRVVNETVAEVTVGRTPNPDILCNQRIKFGVFYDYFGKDFKYIASGHYAQIKKKDDKFYLKQSPDPIKDQTYFLALLNQEQLSRAMFPIGNLKKIEVRKLAKEFNLPNQDRKDSQGICFLGKIKYRDFLREHLGIKKGEIINIESGDEMGEHDGYWYYTIGQRKNIKLSGGPWYVAKKDVKKNIIYINNKYYLRNRFKINKIHWITDKPKKENLEVKIRHGEKLYKCKLKKLEVILDKPDQGIAAGQYAVFYDGGHCLGGGVIR